MTDSEDEGKEEHVHPPVIIADPYFGAAEVSSLPSCPF